MKRKMVGAAAAYVSGLFFASFFNDIRAWLFAAAASIMTIYFGTKRGWSHDDLLLTVAAFVTGFFIFSGYTSLRYDSVAAFDECSGSYSGRIIDMRRYENNRASYTLKGRINGCTPAKVTFYGMDYNAEYGDIISFESCTFSKPSGDYLFDSETYYKSEGIFLSVSQPKHISISHTHSRILRNKTAKLREKLIRRLKADSDDLTGAFLSGMIFGEKRSLSDNVKESLYRSGIGHILAVSGLHISIIALLVMETLKKFRINRFLSYGIMNVVLLLFITIANYPVSALRAAIMLDILYAAALFRRQNDSLNSLAFASVIITFVSPYSIYDAGFLLSVSGTFGIAVFAPFMTKNMRNETLWDNLSLDFTAALCTSVSVLPFSMVFFDEAPVVSPLANVFLVPLCVAAMILGLLYIVTGTFFAPLLYPARILTAAVVTVSEKISNVSFLHISKGTAHTAELLIFLGAACLGYYFINKNRKALALCIASSFMIFGCYSFCIRCSRSHKVIAAVLGRGSSAAVVVSYMGDVDVIDISGNSRSAEYVAKYLKTNGCQKIDHLILTKRADAQYSAYLSELSTIRTDEIVAMSDNGESFGFEDSMFGESGITLERSSCTLCYKNGILTVSCRNDDLILMPASQDASGMDGILIKYGRRSKNSDNDGCTFLDRNNNNFEIFLSDNDRLKRRL